MSLIITRNFKRAKAQDAAARDAKFKKGDKVRRGKQTGIVRDIEKEPYIEVKFTDQPVTVFVHESEIVAADSIAADADEFKIGTMVRFKAGEYKGKVFRLQEFHGDYARLVSPVGSVSIPKHLLKDEVSVAEDSSASDAADGTEKIAQDSAIVALFQPLADAQAELRDGNKKSNVKNVLAAAITAAEKEFKGNPFSSRDKRIIDDAKKVLAQFDSAELNNDADLRAALSKMADIAKRLTDAKVSFKAGCTPDGIGEIILEFPNIESARKYNYYKLFNAWDAARSQIVPRWAVNIGGYRVPRIEGNRMTISVLHFST